MTYNHDLATLMLFLVDPRTDDDKLVDTIEALDAGVAKELLTMLSAWTVGRLEMDAERHEITIPALMEIVAREVRETADELDNQDLLDHEGGVFR